MTLVDTSAWVACLERGSLRIERFVPFDEVVTCLPVMQEVLRGFGDESVCRRATAAFLALPTIECRAGVEPARAPHPAAVSQASRAACPANRR